MFPLLTCTAAGTWEPLLQATMRRKSRWSGRIPSRRCCKTFCLSPFSINSSRYGLSVRESERSGCLRGAQRAKSERPAAWIYSPPPPLTASCSLCAVKWSRRRQALAVEASRTVGDALMQLPRHCRVSPPAPTYTTDSNTTDAAAAAAATTQAGASTTALSHQQPRASEARSRSPGNRGRAREESSLGFYLSLQSHVGFVIDIDFIFIQASPLPFCGVGGGFFWGGAALRGCSSSGSTEQQKTSWMQRIFRKCREMPHAPHATCRLLLSNVLLYPLNMHFPFIGWLMNSYAGPFHFS